MVAIKDIIASGVVSLDLFFMNVGNLQESEFGGKAQICGCK